MSLALVVPTAAAPKETFDDVVARMFADKTFVVSPTSLNVVLHIAKDASRGRTADEIAPLLFDDDLQAQNTAIDSGTKFTNASGVWISSEFPGNPKFNALISREYGVTVARVNFVNGDGQKVIADWVARLTDGTLRGLQLTPETEFVLANIQVFDGKWTEPFDPQDTKSETFHGRRGDEMAPMMSRTGIFLYYASALGQTVILKYAGPYRILFFLPNNPADPPLETFLRQGRRLPLKTAAFKIQLPRLHVNTSNFLTAPLEQLGMRMAFRANADFSPMLGRRENARALMFQNVDLRVDETRNHRQGIDGNAKIYVSNPVTPDGNPLR